MATVDRVERKPVRQNKVYVQRVYPGINSPKPVSVSFEYTQQGQEIIPTKVINVIEVNEEVIPLEINENDLEETIVETEEIQPKHKGRKKPDKQE